jgi:hypothetical protein
VTVSPVVPVTPASSAETLRVPGFNALAKPLPETVAVEGPLPAHCT